MSPPIKPKFPKPTFADLLKSYKTDPKTVHACSVVNPADSAVNTCACRMSEALVIANKLIKSRAAIGKLGDGKGDGKKFLLGKYGYSHKLCPHGLGRGAQDVGGFLAQHWGTWTSGWEKPGTEPASLKDKTGVIMFGTIPGFDGQGHIDLWNKTKAVGHAYWDAAVVWFWKMD